MLLLIFLKVCLVWEVKIGVKFHGWIPCIKLHIKLIHKILSPNTKDTLNDNYSLPEPFEQILRSPQEANQHQAFVKAFLLLGFLMFLRSPSGKRLSRRLPLPNHYLLHQDNQEQQSQRLSIEREKQVKQQLLKCIKFKTMKIEKKTWQCE